ncbi:nascent polypeptide-associated complex protein [Candidatus Pacearchaeota archaeon]|nr:nascent polypeptide-associated complex protein [Candidatus Pacearchaeota archaeon]
MIPGINPKQMQAAMKQMGIAQDQIHASRVIIEKTDGTRTIIVNPEVMKIKMQGNVSYQISGDEVEESEEPETTSEDVETVMEKTGKDKETATKALEDANGDLAEAILNLSVN